jgi:hypothetical protein
VFFKSPMVEKGHVPEHGLPSQQRALHRWLEQVHSRRDEASPSEENGKAGVPEKNGTEGNGTAPESVAPSGGASSSVVDG